MREFYFFMFLISGCCWAAVIVSLLDSGLLTMNLLKQSTMTIRYLLPLSVCLNGPVKSVETSSFVRDGIMICISAVLSVPVTLTFWHKSQVRTYSITSRGRNGR